MRGHNILAGVSRSERRLLIAAEAKARRTGEWGDWERLTFPRGSAGSGWAAEFTIAHRNKCFSVLDRTLSNGVRHLTVSSLSNVRPTWREMQRIKDDLAGLDATAVEVYPPRSEIVDEAEMFHIWVLRAPLGFGLKK
jgi:hypothetical protein